MIYKTSLFKITNMEKKRSHLSFEQENQLGPFYETWSV